jgi:DNA-binding transcriptional LysR family regulator
VHARAHRQLLAAAAADMGGDGRAGGELALAASTTIAAHVLPPLLARFRALEPAVRLRLTIANTAEVVAGLAAGRVALGLVEGLTRASGVRLEPWLDDELVPVLGRDARWSPRRADDLAEVPLLWREPGSGTRAVVARALGKAGVRTRPAPFDLELASNEAVAGCAAAGLGLAFLSRWSLAPQLAAGRLRPVPALGLAVRRTFAWALPAGGLARPAESFRRVALAQPPVSGG